MTRDGIYDLIVVGGGLLGAGIARDAAQRGLSVCLFEQEDFGAGATGRGNPLALGSLGALETLDFTHVREDIRERTALLRVAPHLAHRQPCLIPFYTPSLRAQTRLRGGLTLLDALSLDQALPIHRNLSAAEAGSRMPALSPEGLTGAALVWEAEVPAPDRLTLELALDARRFGACLRPHVRVDSLLREGGKGKGGRRASGVRWTDTLTGECGVTFGGLSVLAAGAWAAGLDPRFEEGFSRRLTRRVSALLPPLEGLDEVLALPIDDEGRLLFVVPRRQGVWVGISETDPGAEAHRDHVDRDQAQEQAHASGAEVAALLRPVRAALPAAGEPVLAQAWAHPPRPAAPTPFTPSPSEVFDHAANGGRCEGLLSASGAGLAQFRAVAEEAVDLACRKLGRALSTPPCRTAALPLPMRPLPQAFFDTEAALREGVEAAVADEECRTLRDFLERRTALFWTADRGRAAVPVALDTLSSLLGWDPARQARERRAWETDVALTQAFRVM